MVSENAAVWDKEWARIESDSARRGLRVGKINGVVGRQPLRGLVLMFSGLSNKTFIKLPLDSRLYTCSPGTAPSSRIAP